MGRYRGGTAEKGGFFMFSTLSELPAVNIYVFTAIVVVVSYGAYRVGRAAYTQVGSNSWLRYMRWVVSALLSVLVLSAITLGRLVPGDQVGVSKERVYTSGWHVYPKESFVIVPRAGMFIIPYPDDRRFLEVSYLITSSDRLRGFSDEIKAFKTPIAEGFVLFGSSKRDAWRASGDPFAAWLMWKTTKFLPSENAVSGQLEVYLAALASYGVTTDVKLYIQQWRSKS